MYLFFKAQKKKKGFVKDSNIKFEIKKAKDLLEILIRN